MGEPQSLLLTGVVQLLRFMLTKLASIHLTLQLAGGSDAIASGEGCRGVIAPEACPPSPDATRWFRWGTVG